MKITLSIFVSIFLLVLSGCTSNSNGPDNVTLSGITELRAENVNREKPDVPDSDLNALVNSNTLFAFDLYRQLTDMPDNSGKNIFFSPYSISAALAMTLAGAQEQTESEMHSALRFTLREPQLHSAFNQLDSDLQSAALENENALLVIVNQLWGQIKWPFQKSFLEVLARNYGAGMNLLNFQKEPDSSRIVINQWVEEKTQNKIKDLLPPGSIDESTALVLTNVIYFLADWKNQFNPALTEKSSFTMTDGKTVNTPLMTLSEPEKKTTLRAAITSKSIAVELPYAGNRLAMIAVLPISSNFLMYEQEFDTSEYFKIISNLDSTEMRVVLPRFSYGTPSMKLRTPLEKMGMRVPFSNADFSGMDGTKDLYIDDIYHKAFISVDEKGTEAAAATAVVMTWESAIESYDFVANRPFLYFIRDQVTNTVLFMGRVMDPTDAGE